MVAEEISRYIKIDKTVMTRTHNIKFDINITNKIKKSELVFKKTRYYQTDCIIVVEWL